MPLKWQAFGAALVVRALCARYSIIPDCDEVFNYWEPTHFLTNNFGLQTWEYSPIYAIRSWAYVSLHAIVIKTFQFLAPSLPNYAGFYALRACFALVSAWAEARLYDSIARNLSRRVATLYLVFSLLSAGMFHASVSYLPSSFAMHTFTMALANFIDSDRRTVSLPGAIGLEKTARSLVNGLGWIAVGGLLGWPFCLVLSLPFGLRFLATSLVPATRERIGVTLLSIARVVVRVGALLLSIVYIDGAFYKKVEVVPYNIVAYNVLNQTEDSGPNIFGTEPWWYYFVNLAMNFNGAFLLALSAIVTPLFASLSWRGKVKSGQLLVLASPFYLWLAIFSATPHKEERFMYVVYPSLCLNAALALNDFILVANKLLRLIGIRWALRGVALASVIVAAIGALSLSRSVALGIYYGAPVDVFLGLPQTAGNVCIGREWYRYPSSYFLDDAQRLKFLKSGFSGLLPGEFAEEPKGENSLWWERRGIHSIPEGMNDKNLEDPKKYTPLEECNFVVDIDMPAYEAAGELWYAQHPEWTKAYCTRFLDSGESRGIGRVLWIPEALHSVTRTHLVWVEYCVMARSIDYA